MTTRALQPRLGRSARLDPRAAALGLTTATLAAAAATSLGPEALAIPVGLAVAAFFVWQPLALLALFIYVGLFKDEAALKALPFDATFALGVLLAAICFYRFLRVRAGRFPFGLAAPLAVLALMLLLSLGWTPSPGYGTEKTERFLTLTLLATVAPFVLIKDARDIRRLFQWTIALALLTAALALTSPPQPAQGRLEFGGEANTIGVSQLLCVGSAILLLAGLGGRVWARWWSISGGVLLMITAAAVGSRGPVLSLILALLITAAAWSLRVPRKVVPILVVVAAGLVIVPSVPLPEIASQRLERAISSPVTTLENNGRWAVYGQAVGLIREHPLRGTGAGGFQSVGVLAGQNYPHNLFLELFAELGIGVVLVVLAAIVALLVRLLRTAWHQPEPEARELVYVILGVVLLLLFCVQVSGDINENRSFWAMFGLAWMVVHNPHALSGGRAIG